MPDVTRFRDTATRPADVSAGGAYIERLTTDMVHDWIGFEKHDMLG